MCSRPWDCSSIIKHVARNCNTNKWPQLRSPATRSGNCVSVWKIKVVCRHRRNTNQVFLKRMLPYAGGSRCRTSNSRCRDLPIVSHFSLDFRVWTIHLFEFTLKILATPSLIWTLNFSLSDQLYDGSLPETASLLSTAKIPLPLCPSITLIISPAMNAHNSWFETRFDDKTFMPSC